MPWTSQSDCTLTSWGWGDGGWGVGVSGGEWGVIYPPPQNDALDLREWFCTLTSYPPKSSLHLCPPPHLLSGAALSLKNPRFFLVFKKTCISEDENESAILFDGFESRRSISNFLSFQMIKSWFFFLALFLQSKNVFFCPVNAIPDPYFPRSSKIQ